MRGRIRTLACVSLAALAAPAGAQGAVRLGPDVGVKPPGSPGLLHLGGVGCQAGASYTPCTYANLQSSNPGVTVAAPADGIITRWRFRAGLVPQAGERKLTLKLFRQGSSGSTYPQYGYLTPPEGVRTGPSFAIPAGNQITADAPVVLPARLAVKAGEIPGVVADNPIGFSAYDVGDAGTSGAVYGVRFVVAAKSPVYLGQIYGVWFDNAAVAFDVTVEKDADADGYGDETQDCFPADPARQGGCTPPILPGPPPPLIAFKPSPPGTPPPSSAAVFAGFTPGGPISYPRGGDGSRIYIALACPSGARQPCGGYLIVAPEGASKAAARRPRLLAKVRYSIAAGKRKRLLVTLSRHGRALLKSKRRLRVVIRTQPRQGKAASIRKTLVWRGKAKPKRRARRSAAPAAAQRP